MFANTLKYVLITTSANLGNMRGVAGPALPASYGGSNPPQQFPVRHPRHRDRRRRRRARTHRPPQAVGHALHRQVMLEFGTVSSVFDVVTFVVLLAGFAASEAVFRTGWFVQSLLTELAVALVMRTRRPFFRSRPGRLLLYLTVVVAVVAVLVPYLPLASLMGFVPLRPWLVTTLLLIVLLYVATTEAQKRWFYRTAA